MDKKRRMELIGLYKRCSDDDLDQMIREGKDSFEEGAYELILAEATKRGIDDENDDYEVNDESGHEFADEIDFKKMNTEDLIGVLINLHAMDELNFHLASAEAIRRNIDASDVRAYKKIVNCEKCSDSVEIDIIENPRPLVIIKTIDEAGLYTDTLDEEGVPYGIQIIVDDEDYKKAEMVTNYIMFPSEDD